jgi:sulfhydrogenase subunit beta (sulfur reductase)
MAVAGHDAGRAVLTRADLERLVEVLVGDGFRVLGPTVRDGAIVYGPIASLADLPAGVTEVQEAGRYRLERRADAALFGFASGPESLKRSFFAPRVTVLRARKKDGSFVVLDPPAPQAPLAVLGARSCDLHAVAIQDRVLLEGAHADPDYAQRRAGTFIVAIDCTEPGGTCFCVSMGTGPKTSHGFDLALTELLDDDGHRFVVAVGTSAGARMLERVGGAPAPAEDQAKADAAVEGCASRMGRALDTRGIKELLYDNVEHPRWNDVADRCLACANCTLVCPTCFCATVEDITDLTGETAERERRWDSCFSLDHSYVHGGPVRASTRSRYRQWLTHKLASWIDQFGSSGCVGCGRCITWCPVGIDLTEEVAAMRESRRT